MLNIEVIRFEAQDVITASVAAPVVPSHTHHWKFGGAGQIVGMADNKAKLNCIEDGCDSYIVVDQPVGILDTYTW